MKSVLVTFSSCYEPKEDGCAPIGFVELYAQHEPRDNISQSMVCAITWCLF